MEIAIEEDDAIQHCRDTACQGREQNMIDDLIAHCDQCDLALWFKAKRCVGRKVGVNVVVGKLATKPHEEGPTGNMEVLSFADAAG